MKLKFAVVFVIGCLLVFWAGQMIAQSSSGTETNQTEHSGNSAGSHVSEPSSSKLHDVIGTNAPKDGMSEPTLTNQPIQKVPLK